MEISGAIIVQVTRLSGELQVLGLDYRQNIHDRDSTMPFLLLEGVTDTENVLKSFSFRRKPAGQHWFSYSHLLQDKHVKKDKTHRARLLLQIPIREELPFIDLMPAGSHVHNGKLYIVFCLHTNASLQPTDHERMFFTHKPMEFLRTEAGMYELITSAIETHGIES